MTMDATWTMYGLKTCDTCRKARAWLQAAGVAHSFVDLRAAPLPADTITRWFAVLGEGLLNRRGTTWRGLDDTQKAKAATPEGLVALCAAWPALMKRPVFVRADRVLGGFDAATRQALAQP